jgi:hypothetical protein
VLTGFRPQKDAKSAEDVQGLGDGSLDPSGCASIFFKPGKVKTVAIGSDGVFGSTYGPLVSDAFAVAARGDSRTLEQVCNKVVQTLDEAVQTPRATAFRLQGEHAREEAALDKRFSQRHGDALSEAEKSAQAGVLRLKEQARKALDGLDDVALVVFRPTKKKPA